MRCGSSSRSRFGYGDAIPWVTRHEGLHTMTAGPDSVALWTRVATHGEDMRTVADFTAVAGQQFPFILTWYQSHTAPPRPVDPWFAVETTDLWWQVVGERVHLQGDPQRAVLRSLITLKALTYEPTGGIVAAATTSLPEAIGGNRNWDYRYCWLRDATLTLEALMRGGYHEEALAWRDWLLRATAGDPSQAADHVRSRRASDASTSGWRTGFQATRDQLRCGLGTQRPDSTSSTSTARSCRPCTPLRRPTGCIAGPSGISR